jgi:hypothetical protein
MAIANSSSPQGLPIGPDSALERNGFELSLKIQPKENCGFSDLAISGIVPQTGAK